MLYINLECPPLPHLIVAGTALYRRGDMHRRRSNIGVFDIILVKEGMLYITEEDTSYTLSKNHILILCPDKTHFGFEPCSSETFFYWLHMNTFSSYSLSSTLTPCSKQINSNYQEHFFNVILPKYAEIPELEAHLLFNYFDQITTMNINKYTDKYMNKIGPKNQQLSPLDQQELLLKILKLIQISPTNLHTSNNIAFEIMEYFQLNYEKPLKLEELSKKYNFHPVHIIRCMKKTYGLTPIEALCHVRLEKAKTLLFSTDLSVHDIGYQVGFSSPSYFIKQFKRHIGTTPSQYRSSRF